MKIFCVLQAIKYYCSVKAVNFVIMIVIIDYYYYYFFFFQAEDGIRDWSVTGVQTCALPISTHIEKSQLPE